MKLKELLKLGLSFKPMGEKVSGHFCDFCGFICGSKNVRPFLEKSTGRIATVQELKVSHTVTVQACVSKQDPALCSGPKEN